MWLRTSGGGAVNSDHVRRVDTAPFEAGYALYADIPSGSLRLSGTWPSEADAELALSSLLRVLDPGVY